MLLICPVLRHVASNSFNDPTHMENFNSPVYEDELLEFQDQRKRILGTWGLLWSLRLKLWIQLPLLTQWNH